MGCFLLGIIGSITSVVIITILIFLWNLFIKDNEKFYNIINDFSSELPPSHKASKKVEKNDLQDELKSYSKYTIFNCATLSPEMSQYLFDKFIKKLEDFKPNKFTIYKNQIEIFKRNLLRFEKIDLLNIDTTEFSTLSDIIQDKNNIPYFYSNYTLIIIKYKIEKITKFFICCTEELIKISEYSSLNFENMSLNK